MLDALRLVRAHDNWVLQFWFFGLGACVGSFLNVCIFRLPAGKSIVTPGSHCACGRPIPWYNNIPIFTWFILRGKAACCGRKFSFRYPLIEAITAGTFLWLWTVLPPRLAVPGMVFFSLLLMGAMIDVDHMILPDATTIGGMFAGVLLSCLLPQLHGLKPTGFPFADMLQGGIMAVIGIMAGTTVIFWIRELGELVLKREAMGYGDILLMGCIGAFCGWQGAVFSIFGGAVAGLIFMMPMMIYARLTGRTPAAEVATLPTEPPAAKAMESEGAPPAAREAAVPPAPIDGTPVGDDSVEAAPSPAVFGVEIPFGPWLALGGFLYYAVPWLRWFVDNYFANLRTTIFDPASLFN